MSIKFGPAGLGKVSEAVAVLEKYHSLGIKACEIAFTYGVYIHKKEDALEIGKVAKKLGISLSIHAPYWINLNSAEKIKIAQSKKRILDCCKVGTYLGATHIVFHPGYYGKMSVEETYDNIKKEMLDLQKEISKNKYTPKLAPETTGKVNVFGSVDEILALVRDTKCSFCIDFAHILARYKDYKFREIFDKFKKFKDFHIHFSGIVYGEKGERNHIMTPKKDFEQLISIVPRGKNATIINESPTPVEDSVIGIKLYEKRK